MDVMGNLGEEMVCSDSLFLNFYEFLRSLWAQMKPVLYSAVCGKRMQQRWQLQQNVSPNWRSKWLGRKKVMKSGKQGNLIRRQFWPLRLQWVWSRLLHVFEVNSEKIPGQCCQKSPTKIVQSVMRHKSLCYLQRCWFFSRWPWVLKIVVFRINLFPWQSCDRLITTGMSGAVVPFLQIGNWEALSLLAELGRRSLEMPMPGRVTCFLLCVCWGSLKGHVFFSSRCRKIVRASRKLKDGKVWNIFRWKPAWQTMGIFTLDKLLMIIPKSG